MTSEKFLIKSREAKKRTAMYNVTGVLREGERKEAEAFAKQSQLRPEKTS
jgi:hypothetical protein